MSYRSELRYWLRTRLTPLGRYELRLAREYKASTERAIAYLREHRDELAAKRAEAHDRRRAEGREVRLTEFLLARIAEEERPCVWMERSGACGGPWCRDDCRVCSGGDAETDNEWTLTQCVAYRRIVDEASELLALNEGTSIWMTAAAHARRTLRHLATIWADHADYDPDWVL